MGVLATGCEDKAGAPKPQEPIHANATANPTPDVTPSMNATAAPMTSGSATPSASASAGPKTTGSAGTLASAPVPHTINAPPQPQPKPASSK